MCNTVKCSQCGHEFTPGRELSAFYALGKQLLNTKQNKRTIVPLFAELQILADTYKNFQGGFMNSSILTAIESLCDDIVTNTNTEDNKKRAEAVVSLALAGMITPAEYDDEYEDEEKAAESESEETAVTVTTPAPGEHFTRGGIEFVALGMEQGGLLAVVANVIEDEMAYDKSGFNDWRKSSIRKYLNEEFIKNFESGDLLPFVCDLTSDNGMTDYGTSEDYVALLSDSLYRKYRKFVPQYGTWVWTITPWNCAPANTALERLVTTSGALSGSSAHYGNGVAPACIFNPEIFK